MGRWGWGCQLCLLGLVKSPNSSCFCKLIFFYVKFREVLKKAKIRINVTLFTMVFSAKIIAVDFQCVYLMIRSILVITLFTHKYVCVLVHASACFLPQTHVPFCIVRMVVIYHAIQTFVSKKCSHIYHVHNTMSLR